MKKTIFALMLTSLFATANAEQPTAASVKKLMKITGAGELGIQAMNQMTDQLKPMLPAAPDSFWEDMKKETTADELISLITPIYQKHLTQSDVDAAIEFYQTPAGKNFVAAQPQIMQESMQVGEKWGTKVAQKIINKYKIKYKNK